MENSQHLVNPQDYVLKRKRKKYRFALFHNASNCFELTEWTPLKAKDIVVEVGSGTGMFLVELAKQYPEKEFIAVDVKADRLQKGARAALDAGCTNIYFVRARADQLSEVVQDKSVADIWLTFSDPFPKKRDAKRRLTHKDFLDLYKNAHVQNNARLFIKTDSHELFDWTLEQLIGDGWFFQMLTYDLHDSKLSDDFKIMTTYEKRWTDKGLPIYFVCASRSRTH